jgi:hypothetical protein
LLFNFVVNLIGLGDVTSTRVGSQMRCVKASTPVFAFRLAMAAIVVVCFAATTAGAQQPSPTVPPQLPSNVSPALPPAPPRARYSSDEIIDAGHHFFGGISQGIASIVEKAVKQWGQPNGYTPAKRQGAPSSAACGTAMVRYIPKMLATSGFSGRGQQSASISEALARAR